MVERLKGKVALVVGAGSIGPGWGNGKATAVAFAREGARVFCADINPAAAEETAGIIRSEGGEAVAHCADVSKAADVAAMVAACASAYGRIDVLDNNVGVAEVGGVVEVSEADWDRVFAVNLKSAYLTMKHIIPLMVRQDNGGSSTWLKNIDNVLNKVELLVAGLDSEVFPFRCLIRSLGSKRRVGENSVIAFTAIRLINGVAQIDVRLDAM